jgi:hypothetical protein
MPGSHIEVHVQALQHCCTDELALEADPDNSIQLWHTFNGTGSYPDEPCVASKPNG